MAAMEVEAEDERQSLMGKIIRHGGIYKTQRSRRIRGRVGRWIREGRSPDEEHCGRPYSLVFDCCAISINLQNEIITMYYAPVRHCFHRFFPELDSLVVDPADYLIRSTPQPRLQSRACHSLAERIRLAATIDLNRVDPTREKGRAMGEEIHTMIERWKDEDSDMLMKLRTEPAERPKKDKLAVYTDYSRLFKPNPIKEKPRSKRDNKRAERLLSSLKEFGLTPTATTRTPTPTPSLKAI